LPEWLLVARREEGVQEKRSLEENEKRILEYLATAPGLKALAHKVRDKATKKMVDTEYKMSEVDETPWCGCFVNWCLIKAGLPRGHGALARKWLTYGTEEPINQPRVGAITVVHKEPTKAIGNMTLTGFHVGFYVGGPPSAPTLLGGNQGDRVCRKSFAGWKVRGYRWPVEPQQAGAAKKKRPK
jgi:uncharacterized protein (TIGR02594 family)